MDANMNTSPLPFKKKSWFSGKRVVIMGLGAMPQGSGMGAAVFCLRHGAQVLVTDIKSAVDLAEQVRILTKYFRAIPKASRGELSFRLGGHQWEDFAQADLIIQNPAVPADDAIVRRAKRAGIPITNDWGIFLTLKKVTLLGVTGTRGKSTTTTLLHRMIKQIAPRTQLVGNIGCSPLLVFEKIKTGDIVVAELSSFLLHHFSCLPAPHIAIFTNIMPDHLDKYKTFRAYLADKQTIYTYQKKSDYLIYNADNTHVRQSARRAPGRAIPFRARAGKDSVQGYIENSSVSRAVFVRGRRTIELFTAKDLALVGEHNMRNALSAAMAALLMGVTPAQIKKALKGFTGLSGRLEVAGTVEGITFYNDTSATTPEAALLSIESVASHVGVGGGIVWIGGGHDKNLDYRVLAQHLIARARAIILFEGTASQKLIPLLKKASCPVFTQVASMQDALAHAYKHAHRGDIVLLAPGAASFGVFRNQYDRGNQFMEGVKALGEIDS